MPQAADVFSPRLVVSGRAISAKNARYMSAYPSTRKSRGDGGGDTGDVIRESSVPDRCATIPWHPFIVEEFYKTAPPAIAGGRVQGGSFGRLQLRPGPRLRREDLSRPCGSRIQLLVLRRA